MASSAAFGAWAAELPEAVRQEIVETRGLNTAALVANCVIPEFGNNPRPVDVVFVATITESLPEVKPGTSALAKTLTFFRQCYGVTHNTKQEDDDGAILEPKDTEAEEYYTLKPAYKRGRLEALNEARQHEVEDARLPSARLWGRYEKLKRVDTEFVPLLPEKVQSEEMGKKKPAASMLAPLKDGVLGWRLPAIHEAPPTSFDEFENWCYIVENLLYLTKWVSSIKVLETFHNRFWSRVRANRQPRSGYRNLTVTEYLDAYMTFQAQWKKASKHTSTLDDAILACLPADNDAVDGRLALAPRLAVQPAFGDNSHTHGIVNPDVRAYDASGPWDQPSKRRRLSRGQRAQKQIQSLKSQIELHEDQNPKGKAKGKGKKAKAKGGGKGSDKTGDQHDGNTEQLRRIAKGQWCKNFSDGNCKFGDKCWFRHD
jgi:hypothetical protein